MAKNLIPYKIKKEFYKQITEQVQWRLGAESKDISNYRKKYEADLRKKWSISSSEELLKALDAASMVLLADFHPLQQSQKSHLRLLKKLTHDRPIALGLECLFIEDQVKVDKFIQGKLGEQEFLKSIQWKKKWGFAWEHYRPLFVWAKENDVQVFALNRSNTSKRTQLRSHDEWVAKRLRDLFTSEPLKDHRWIVIYGDLHLAEAHLPANLKANIPILNRRGQLVKVFQNPEKIYFDLLKNEKEADVDVVRWSQSSFGLINVPPWVKWQNYLLYLEQTYDLELDDETTDNTDHIAQYVKLLSKEFQIEIDESDLSVYSAQDDGLWKLIESGLDKNEGELVELMIEEERSFYLPQLNLAYLSRFSINHAAALAMLYLNFKTAQIRVWKMKLPSDFKRLIWLEALSYFGSKVINPKRKTETLYDVKKMLSNKSIQENEKETLKLALAQKMHELLILTQRKSERFNFVPKRKTSYLRAAQILGGIMGERLFVGYRTKTLSLKTLVSLLRKDWSHESFDQIYYEIAEIVESLPPSFKSKSDRL